jgi:hypothetical protein
LSTVSTASDAPCPVAVANFLISAPASIPASRCATLPEHVLQARFPHLEAAVNELDEGRDDQRKREHRNCERKRGFNQRHDSPQALKFPPVNTSMRCLAVQTRLECRRL